MSEESGGPIQPQQGGGLWRFLWENKIWWLLPIGLLLVLLAAIVIFAANGATPAMYAP